MAIPMPIPSAAEDQGDPAPRDAAGTADKDHEEVHDKGTDRGDQGGTGRQIDSVSVSLSGVGCSGVRFGAHWSTSTGRGAADIGRVGE